MKEYSCGMGHEIYRIQIFESEYGENWEFRRIAEIAYTDFTTVVFALELEVKNSTKTLIRGHQKEVQVSGKQKFTLYYQ